MAVVAMLVIVLDGLRPDYVTPELMPNLYALSEQGVVFENHHSVFPTVTRVNSASISTGTYPGIHGLLGNTVYIPEVDPAKGLSTSNAQNLIKIDEATGGKLLTATTLGEVLEARAVTLLAVSSGSSGSAMLLNHTAAGGGVINTGIILPPEQAEQVATAIGAAPGNSVPATARNAWVVDAYIEIGLKKLKPAVTLMWLTDPDHTAHEAGVGAPLTLQALREVDAEIGRILSTHEALGLSVNVMVTSDHGFSTHTGGANLLGLLKKHELDEGVVIADGAIYVEGSRPKRVRRIVEVLQGSEAVGAIFTRAKQPGAYEGALPGTFSFDAILWNHARGGDILISPNWTDAENEYGYKGTTTLPGVAGHGSASPFDIHNTLIAAGPSFKKGIRSAVPTANTDIAPTILHMMGIEAPASMYGRPIVEAIEGRPGPESVEVRTREFAAEAPGYRVVLSESVVAGRRYFNYARVER